MEQTIYVALSRMTALRHQMDVVANNIANMNTTAFKGERVLFEEYVQRTQLSRPTSYVRDYGLIRDVRNGPIEITERPLDVAIEGEGFFVILTPQGEFYSRNGAFSLNADGELVHMSGHPVLADTGQPILIDTDLGQPSIDSTGVISDGEGNEVGRLDLVVFDDERDLRGLGDSLYTTDQPALPAEAYTITQFALEGSNVNAIREMTNMMTLSRTYQSTQQMIERTDSLDRKAIQQIGKPV